MREPKEFRIDNEEDYHDGIEVMTADDDYNVILIMQQGEQIDIPRSKIAEVILALQNAEADARELAFELAMSGETLEVEDGDDDDDDDEDDLTIRLHNPLLNDSEYLDALFLAYDYRKEHLHVDTKFPRMRVRVNEK